MLLCFQISSKLKRMTPSPQKAKAATPTSKTLFHHVGYFNKDYHYCDILCLLVNRFSVSHAHDISNSSYMGVSYRSGNMGDKGWSYSMPPKSLPIAGQGGKDSKKCSYDVGTRSPTGKPFNPTWVALTFFFFSFSRLRVFSFRKTPTWYDSVVDETN